VEGAYYCILSIYKKSYKNVVLSSTVPSWIFCWA